MKAAFRIYFAICVLLLLVGCSSITAYKKERSNFGQNDLMRAVYYGDELKVQTLIDRGVDLSEKDDSGATVFHYAARYGDAAIGKLLLDKAEPDALNQTGGIQGDTPIEEALVAGNKQVYELFRRYVVTGNDEQAKAKLEERDGYLLHRATASGDDQTVEQLLAKGADPNKLDNEGNTPAHLLLQCLSKISCGVAESSAFRTFQALVDAGMDSELIDGAGKSVADMLKAANSLYLIGKAKAPYTKLEKQALNFKFMIDTRKKKNQN